MVKLNVEIMAKQGPKIPDALKPLKPRNLSQSQIDKLVVRRLAFLTDRVEPELVSLSLFNREVI